MITVVINSNKCKADTNDNRNKLWICKGYLGGKKMKAN